MNEQTIYTNDVSSTVGGKGVKVSNKDIEKEVKLQDKTNAIVEKQKVDKLVNNNGSELMHVSNVFPFDLFTDTLTIDKNKVSLKYGLAPFTSHTFSLFIKDIKTVQVTTGILFGRVTLEVIGYEENPPVMEWLWNKDALKVKRVLIGLMAMISQEIDLSHFKSKEILQNAAKIGKEHEAAPAIA